MAKRKMTDVALAKLSYEQALVQLEGILEDVETGETGLEEALDRCEDGARLIAHCRSILDRVQDRVDLLAARKGSDVSHVSAGQSGGGLEVNGELVEEQVDPLSADD